MYTFVGAASGFMGFVFGNLFVCISYVPLKKRREMKSSFSNGSKDVQKFLVAVSSGRFRIRQ